MSVLRRAATIAMLVAATGPAGISTVNASAVEPAHVVAPCPDPVDPVAPVDTGEAEQLLIGTWVLCSGQLLPSTAPFEVGIEFDADGRFFRVHQDDDGGLIKVEGLEQEGEWEFVDNQPGSTQLNLRLLGGGTVIQLIEFVGSPPLLRANGTVDEAALVPWTGAPPAPGVPTGVGEGPCGLPRDPVELTSVSQVEGLLEGTWLVCSESSPFGPLAFGEVGITLTPDGRFFRVYESSQGVLISASGSLQEGTWEVIDTTAMNEPGSYQVDLRLLGAGTFPGHVVVLQQPPHFRLLTMPPFSDFQRATETPVPGTPPAATTPPTTTPTTPPDDALPETGSNFVLALFALGLVAGGFMLVGISRHRPRRSA